MAIDRDPFTPGNQATGPFGRGPWKTWSDLTDEEKQQEAAEESERRRQLQLQQLAEQERLRDITDWSRRGGVLLDPTGRHAMESARLKAMMLRQAAEAPQRAQGQAAYNAKVAAIRAQQQAEQDRISGLLAGANQPPAWHNPAGYGLGENPNASVAAPDPYTNSAYRNPPPAPVAPQPGAAGSFFDAPDPQPGAIASAIRGDAPTPFQPPPTGQQPQQSSKGKSSGAPKQFSPQPYARQW